LRIEVVTNESCRGPFLCIGYEVIVCSIMIRCL